MYEQLPARTSTRHDLALPSDDDSLIERGAFPEALESLRRGGDEPLVTLRADRSLDYGRVMAVMGELNRAGFNSISLVTSGSVEAP